MGRNVVLTEICEILEYENTKQAMLNNVKDKYKLSYYDVQSKGGCQTPFANMHPHSTFINEPGLYSLILKSKMKEAEKFQDWVVEEVLPSISRTGEFKLQQAIKDRDNQLALVTAQSAEKDKQLDKVRAQAAVLANRAFRYKSIVKRVTVRQEKMQWIYIASTDNYQAEGIYKIGRTVRLSRRVSSIQTAKVEDYYYVWYMPSGELIGTIVPQAYATQSATMSRLKSL